MIFSQFGYQAWKYDRDEVEVRYQRVLDGLKRVTEAGIKYDAIAVHGTSGTWLAAALVMGGYNVVMIRKDGERSHGDCVEGSYTGEQQITDLVFIDDLIVTGNTITTAQDILIREGEKAQGYYSENTIPKFVAIVLHNQFVSKGETHEGIPLFGY